MPPEANTRKAQDHSAKKDAAPSELNPPSTSNRVDIWRAQNFDAIELHRGFGVTQEYPRHWHDEIYVCATLDGKSYLETGGATLSAPPGTLMVVPSGEVHANRKIGCSFRCAFVGQRELQTVFEEYVERAAPSVDFRAGLVSETQTAGRFVRLHRMLEGPHSELARDGAVSAFVHQFVTVHTTARILPERGSRENTVVLRAKRFLDENYSRPVRLRELARLAGVNPFRLNRSFCKQIGMPPHAYQLQVRIARAKLFLLQGRSVAETASAAGFFDQSHFTHSFRRAEGITPRQYLHCCKNLQDGKTHVRYFDVHR